MKKYKRHVCECICVSDVLPKWVDGPDTWEKIWCYIPFSVGNNVRSLVFASEFAEHLGGCLGTSKRARALVKRIRTLGSTYLDLEN